MKNIKKQQRIVANYILGCVHTKNKWLKAWESIAAVSSVLPYFFISFVKVSR